jgi:hypothetical protein
VTRPNSETGLLKKDPIPGTPRGARFQKPDSTVLKVLLGEGGPGLPSLAVLSPCPFEVPSRRWAGKKLRATEAGCGRTFPPPPSHLPLIVQPD